MQKTHQTINPNAIFLLGRVHLALDDYLCLIDATGRAIVGEAKGYIPDDLPDILQRLGLNSDIWLDEIKYFDKWYYKAIGTVDNLRKFCQSIHQKWIKGLPKNHKPIKT